MLLKDDRVITILDKMGFPLHLATLEFFLFICNKIEPLLTFLQAEQPLEVFLYEKLKELLTWIIQVGRPLVVFLYEKLKELLNSIIQAERPLAVFFV